MNKDQFPVFRHPVISDASRQSEKNKSGRKKYLIPFLRIKRIRIHHFLLISVVIFLLPILGEWKLLFQGERLTAHSLGEQYFMIKQWGGDEVLQTRCGLEYTFNSVTYRTYTPENYMITAGKDVPIIIKSHDPEYMVIATLAGFYLKFNRAVAVFMVFLIWTAIYVTLIQYQKGLIR